MLLLPLIFSAAPVLKAGISHRFGGLSRIRLIWLRDSPKRLGAGKSQQSGR